MNASLDTDIIIHLYSSGKKELLFNNFETLYLHEYLYEVELRKKALQVYQDFTDDMKVENIKVISNSDLIELGIKVKFEKLMRDYEYLFDGGEMRAVALAKAIGIAAFVSDDTKEFGPHETLVKELIEEVIPFAFYELLFLEYLSSKITAEEMHQIFVHVTSISMAKHPMKFKSKMFSTVRRFTSKRGTKRDMRWIKEFCGTHGVNYNDKMKKLKAYLDQIG